mmetsp:Transcript_16159/g.50560  ORF Transcript_16159/g.50560 Transcript_16159/m.50560 type:complete len:319 (+) Transcript_16159:275-1231(+)
MGGALRQCGGRARRAIQTDGRVVARPLVHSFRCRHYRRTARQPSTTQHNPYNTTPHTRMHKRYKLLTKTCSRIDDLALPSSGKHHTWPSTNGAHHQPPRANKSPKKTSTIHLGLREDTGGVLGAGSINNFGNGLALGVRSGRSDLALGLQALKDLSALPANLGSHNAELGHSPVGLDVQDTKGSGHKNTLLVVIGGRHTVKDLQSGHGGGTTRGLVGDHATNGTPHNLAGGTLMEGTVFGVRVRALTKELQVLQLVTRSLTRTNDFLTPNNRHLLPAQQLLGNNGRKTTEQMVVSIDNNFLLKHYEKKRGGKEGGGGW